jgi:peroxiredoxin
MKSILFLFLSVAIGFMGKAQSCFHAYDLLFADENKDLPYSEFHKLELAFLDNLNGCKAIDFNETTLKGNEVNLSMLKGKVVVLNFWFTTCLPCLKEIPELNKLVENYNTDEVVFIGFARDDKEKLEAFFEKFGDFDYNIVPESYLVADAYKVVGWPQSMIIDKEGRVFKSWAGLTENPADLSQQIQKQIDFCLSL